MRRAQREKNGKSLASRKIRGFRGFDMKATRC